MVQVPSLDASNPTLLTAAERVARSVAVWATPATLGPPIRGNLLSNISDKQLRTLATELNLPRKLVNGRLHLETQAVIATIVRMVSEAESYGARGGNLRSSQRDARSPLVQ